MKKKLKANFSWLNICKQKNKFKSYLIIVMGWLRVMKEINLL